MTVVLNGRMAQVMRILLARVSILCLVPCLLLADEPGPAPSFVSETSFGSIPQAGLLIGASPFVAPQKRDQWAERFREIFAPALNPSGKIRRVFYPLGGPDVRKAFALFWGSEGPPEKLVIADLMAFGTPSEILATYQDAQAKENFYDDQAREGLTPIYAFLREVKVAGPAILWELENMGANELEVLYRDAEGRLRLSLPQGQRGADAPSYSSIANDVGWQNPPFYNPLDRDIVEIRFQWAGKPRSVLYVQQDLLSPGTLSPVLTEFFWEGFDAYLEKATLHIADRPEYQSILQLALQGLDPRHGILVTDNPRRDAGFRDLTKAVGSGRFGYGNQAHVLEVAKLRQQGRSGKYEATSQLLLGRPPEGELLFHWTAPAYAQAIEKEGLRVPPTPVRRGYYGSGIYFSTDLGTWHGFVGREHGAPPVLIAARIRPDARVVRLDRAADVKDVLEWVIESYPQVLATRTRGDVETLRASARASVSKHFDQFSGHINNWPLSLDRIRNTVDDQVAAGNLKTPYAGEAFLLDQYAKARKVDVLWVDPKNILVKNAGVIEPVADREQIRWYLASKLPGLLPESKERAILVEHLRLLDRPEVRTLVPPLRVPPRAEEKSPEPLTRDQAAPKRQTQELSLALSASPGLTVESLEKGMLQAVRRIPELEEALRLAQKEGVELLLYGGTTRSLGFYVKKQLQQKGEAFFRDTTTIALEEVVGPYSDLDLIVRGPQEKASKIEQTLRSQFSEGERFYRWEVRTEDFLKEPWQITQGYEPISKILLGKDGFVEPYWRRTAFGKSLTEHGVSEILSGKISYMRNPRYKESEPNRKGEHHELLEAMRYLRFLHEFESVRPEKASLEAVREILREATESGEVTKLLSGQLFRNRFEMNFQKLQYGSTDNVRLARRLQEIGFDDAARKLGYAKQLKMPLEDSPVSSGTQVQRLGKPLVVYHGTKGYKQAWSIYRGGFYTTTYSNPPGVFAATKPEVAKGYAHGEGDFVLKITLSPDARVGEDFVWKEPGVVIIRNRKAIAQVEKPVTALELKGKLQGALIRWVEEPSKAPDAVLNVLSELQNRARQGSGEALLAVASTVVPEPFRKVQRETVVEVLKKEPSLIFENAALDVFRPELLEEIVEKATGPPTYDRSLWLLVLAGNTSLGRIPEPFRSRLLEATLVRGTVLPFRILGRLAANRSIPEMPPEVLATFYQAIRARLSDSGDRTLEEFVRLAQGVQKPRPLGNLPAPLFKKILRTVTHVPGHDPAEILRNFAENSALWRFPGEFFLGYQDGLEKIKDPAWRSWVLKDLAYNASLPKLPETFLEDFAGLTKDLNDHHRAEVLGWLAQNRSLAQFPEPLRAILADSLAGNAGGRVSSRVIKWLALNPGLAQLPAEFQEQFLQAVRRQNPARRDEVFRSLVNRLPAVQLTPAALEDVVQTIKTVRDRSLRSALFSSLAQNSLVDRELLKQQASSDPGPRAEKGSLQTQVLPLKAPEGRVIQGTSLTAPLVELEARLSGRPVPQNLGWTLVFGGDGARDGFVARDHRVAPQAAQEPTGRSGPALQRAREIAQSVTPPRPHGVKGHAKQFGRGMGIWAAALPIADMGTAVIQGRAGEIPGQLAAMAQPESLEMLGLNYGSFALAAEGVQYPMTRLAAQAANRAAGDALARASTAGLGKTAADLAAKKAAAQTFKNIARFAGPAGFLAGSAVADMVMSGGHLDLERWAVNGVAFLGVHAALSATVAPLMIAGLGLSATGIGATVGVPILILAGTMIAVSAIEMGYDYFREHPEVLINAGKALKEGLENTRKAIAGGSKKAGDAIGAAAEGAANFVKKGWKAMFGG